MRHARGFASPVGDSMEPRARQLGVTPLRHRRAERPPTPSPTTRPPTQNYPDGTQQVALHIESHPDAALRSSSCEACPTCAPRRWELGWPFKTLQLACVVCCPHLASDVQTPKVAVGEFGGSVSCHSDGTRCFGPRRGRCRTRGSCRRPARYSRRPRGAADVSDAC